MASMTNTAVEAALKDAIKRQVMDKLEQTLDIVIPREVRNAMLKATPARASHLRPVEPAITAPQGEKCAAIWHELDRLKAAGKEPDLEGIRKIGAKKHWNEHTTRIQFYRWRHAQEA